MVDVIYSNPILDQVLDIVKSPTGGSGRSATKVLLSASEFEQLLTSCSDMSLREQNREVFEFFRLYTDVVYNLSGRGLGYVKEELLKSGQLKMCGIPIVLKENSIE